MSSPLGRRAALPVLRAIPGVEYVEPVGPVAQARVRAHRSARPFQWYLDPIQAFDFWETPRGLGPVRVAVIDSGIDGEHPEFAGRIARRRASSAVRRPWTRSGTERSSPARSRPRSTTASASPASAFPCELLVAKVVGATAGSRPRREAKAIRWAVDSGARVINLSLGGRRDPRNPALDKYSALEQDAVEYAYSSGVVVVAAAGNCDALPCPYRYASYPAALPHVIGVGAMTQRGIAAVVLEPRPRLQRLIAPGDGDRLDVPGFALSDPSAAYPGY